MSRSLAVLALLVLAGPLPAHGLLVPEDKTLPPLAMLDHAVRIAIDDQVATTRVEQTFRNHTDRPLEATYLFPVPAGASVNRFSMWVDGKEVKGELVEADKARKIYTDIVRRTQDPGLLEYLGTNLFRLRVFPVPPRGDQKVALSFTAVARREGALVEYVYPLKTDGKATRTLEKFSLEATVKSQHPVLNVYSPTHALSLKRAGDREVRVTFEHEQALLDKDFQLFYALGDQDVGLTALTHRPLAGEDGFFLFLVAPRVELPKGFSVPRDVVLVLDTSGSMRGPKMEQGRKAMRYCLEHLNPSDRFALINFATTVNRYRDQLVPATTEQLEQGRKWVDALEPTGGTAIDDALAAALSLRTKEPGRTFTVVFFTDGQPTIGETDPEKILKNVLGRDEAGTRVFTFGVGDDVNATLLDRLADQTRAVSTYVRPAEDLEVKASALYDKISHPVLAELKLTAAGEAVRLKDVYPPRLPDLFHGGQLVVLGRYSGHGPAALKLEGMIGTEKKEFVYELTYPARTDEGRGFVEQLWGRRKVGYLMDQIRANGEQKELIEEVVALAKKYGIATPYTSYLIVPDGNAPVAGVRGGGFGGRPNTFGLSGPPPALSPTPSGQPVPVSEFLRRSGDKPEDLAKTRDALAEKELKAAAGAPAKDSKTLGEARAKKEALDFAYRALRESDRTRLQVGKLGVDLSVESGRLKGLTRLDPSAQRLVLGRTCLEIGGVWIDEGYNPKLPVVTVKAMSDAYFRLLARQPRLKELFRLGNHLAWVAPSETVLVIDTTEGKETLSDAEIDALLASKTK